MIYKDRTSKAIKEVYNKHGKEVALSVAIKALQSKDYKDNREMNIELNGELCECILEIIIRDFIKKNPTHTKNWIIVRGLILKDKNNPSSNFLTEIDLILFTPSKLYAFECKSYKGDKTLTKHGTLTSPKYSVDVYKQSKVHESAILSTFGSFKTLADGIALQNVLFEFSLGNLEDNRLKVHKNELLYCNIHNVSKLLEIASLDNVIRWDMKYVKKAVDLIIPRLEVLREKHLQYVKSLHGKGKII